MVVHRVLDGDDQLVDRRCEHIGPFSLEHSIRVPELDERGCDRPVLGILGVREHVLADGLGQADAEVEPRDVGRGSRPLDGDRRLALEEESAFLRRADVGRVEKGGGLGAEEHVARPGRRFNRDRLGSLSGQ